MKMTFSFALLLAGCAAANAQEPIEHRTYFGFDIGQHKYSDSLISDSASSIGATGGFRINRYLSIEGGYLHTQQFSGTVPSEPVTTVQAKVNGLSARAVVAAPISRRVEAIAGLGYNRLKSSAVVFQGSDSASISETDSGSSWLIGVQLRHEHGFIGRLSYEDYNVPGKLSGVTVTLGYLF